MVVFLPACVLFLAGAVPSTTEVFFAFLLLKSTVVGETDRSFFYSKIYIYSTGEW